MKKFFVMVSLLAGSMLMVSCGTGASIGNGNKSQSNTSGASIGAVGSAIANSGAAGNLGGLASAGLSILTSLMGGSTVNANTIIGTWSYQEPHVSFESNSALAKIGGEVFGNKISNTLSGQLTKLGLTEGSSKFTFQEGGKMTLTMKGKTTQGTYTLNGDQLTMTGAFGMTNLTCTVCIHGNQMHMLFDATSLFNIMTKMGSSSSTITSLLGNYNGMKLGWTCAK